MILTEKVIIDVTKSYRFYENKGYEIPKFFDNKKKKYVVKRGIKIEVLVKDLQPKSTVLIKSKCDICRKEREQKFYRYRAICSDCMIHKIQVDENHPSWKHGKCRRKKCIDCGKEIQWACIRCFECREKYLIQFRIKNYCIDCEKEIHKKSIRCSSCANKGKNNPSYNKNLSNDDREKRRTQQGKWKQEVKERNNYTCQCCGYIGEIYDGIMVAHHLNNQANFKEQRTDIENGITLCKECHKKFHNLYGNKTTKEQYEIFINERNFTS